VPAASYPIQYPRVTLPPVPAAQDIEHFGRRHRQAIVWALVALLAGTGITAVAVAPLVPDAAQLPQRVLTEVVVPSGLQSQLDALAAQELTLTRSDITRSTDTVDALLTRLGVRDASAALFLRTDYQARQLLAGRGGKMVQVSTGADGSLQELVGRFPSDAGDTARSHFSRLTVLRGPDGRWMSSLRAVPYGSTTRLASGTIRNSLFGATDEAGLPDNVAAELADIFSTDIDFHRELRKGDTFSVVYEALTADDQPVPWNEGAGRVLAAEFVNGGRAHHAVWFAPTNGRGGYFGVDGQSKRRAFLASPMEFSRVTSGFAMRFHPLMQRWRAHLGVDYGAPIGTPVRSVGDGVVDFSGWQNGYGNVVQVNHGNGKSTLYAHLSRKDVKVGQRVQQGQRVGAVGMTGWSTGPHLHFEFRVNGQHQDPIKVAKTAETVALDAAARGQFADVVRTVQAKLDVAETLLGQRGTGE
jgi:murein DD-endopeptidase MepM/ murein hydrolase activator NlpD